MKKNVERQSIITLLSVIGVVILIAVLAHHPEVLERLRSQVQQSTPVATTSVPKDANLLQLPTPRGIDYPLYFYPVKTMSKTGLAIASGAYIWNFENNQNVAAGTAMAFAFDARTFASNPPFAAQADAGSYVMEIRVNGKVVRSWESRSFSRLYGSDNKPRITYSQGIKIDNGTTWYVPRLDSFDNTGSADYKAAVAKFGPEAFRYVINMDGLLQPGPNTVEIRFPVNRYGFGGFLYIRNAELTTVPSNSKILTTLANAKKVAQLPSAIVEPVQNMMAWNPDFRPAAPIVQLQNVNASGTLLNNVNGITVPITTYISKTGGGWYRIGEQTPVTTAASSMWRSATVTPATVEINKPLSSLTTKTPTYTMVRRMGFYRDSKGIGNRLFIRDTFTNTTNEDIGVKVGYEMKVPTDFADLRLGGDNDPRIIQTYSQRNPTIFVQMGTGGSIGMFAHDDVLRNQAIFSYQNGIAGMRTERLVIPKGKSVELWWDAYIVSDGDYFDFINRVRADIGVKVALKGSYWWMKMDQMELMASSGGYLTNVIKPWVEKNRIYGAVTQSWIMNQAAGQPRTQGLGTQILQPKFASIRATFRNATTALRSISTPIKVFVYNHFFYNSPIETDPLSVGDSWMTVLNTSGKPQRFTYTWGGAYETGGGVIPTLKNSFGKAMTNALYDQIFKKQPDGGLGHNGFYFDESNFPGVPPIGNDPITYITTQTDATTTDTTGMWDGNTALLDPVTFAIKQKVSPIGLISAPFRRETWSKALAGGFDILANDQPVTLKENQDLAVRFTETFVTPSNNFFTHLYSPLVHTYPVDNAAHDLRLITDRLDYGTLLGINGGPTDYLSEVQRTFFPLSNIQLHEGWIQGNERVITNRPVSFKWESNYQTRTWVFSGTGVLLTSDPPLWDAVTSGSMTVKSVPMGGVVVVERCLNQLPCINPPPEKKGDLFVTKTGDALPAQQFLPGALGEPVLRLNFRAQSADIDVTNIQIVASGSGAETIERMEFYKPGQVSFGFATRADCGADVTLGNKTKGEVTFCAVLNARGLVLPVGGSVDVLVRPRIKNNMLGISQNTSLTFWTGPNGIKARSFKTNAPLAPNDGDTVAEEEVFIGTGTPGPSTVIMSGVHSVMLPQLNIVVKNTGTVETILKNTKDVSLLRFEARATGEDIRLTSAVFESASGSLLNGQNYTLWVDSNGDAVVDTIVQQGITGIAGPTGVIRFNALLNGGIVLAMNTATTFEVHADIPSSTIDNDLKLEFADTNAPLVRAEAKEVDYPTTPILSGNVTFDTTSPAKLLILQ